MRCSSSAEAFLYDWEARRGRWIHASLYRKNLAKEPLTLAEYFGDSLGFEYYYRHPRSYVRRGVFSVHEPSPTIRGVNRPMPKGYKLHAGDPVKSLEGIRPLTTEERSRVQTFPEGFVFLGNKTDREQMIGNAVPVNLARFVAQAINEYVQYKEDLSSSKNDKHISYEDYWSRHEVQLALFDPDRNKRI